MHLQPHLSHFLYIPKSRNWALGITPPSGALLSIKHAKFIFKPSASLVFQYPSGWWWSGFGYHSVWFRNVFVKINSTESLCAFSL